MKFHGSFGSWLKQRRKALDLTQAELAEQVSCAEVTIRKIEGDVSRASKQITARLADVLAISLEERAAFVAFARRRADPPPSLLVELTLRVPMHNLPPQLTAFVGREQELAQIAEHLADPSCRLLTLVGSGGIGKTRLALQAADNVEGYADGVYFVSLTPISSITLIASAIASTLRMSLYGQENPTIQIVNYLRQKHMLLVLDNFEHLLEGTSLINEILQAAPKVSILVTSRERLNLSSEIVFYLGGMDFPNAQTTQDVFEYSAIQLFIQSVQRTQPGFILQGNDSRHVTRICQLVQGMPLGILLAAAWIDTLSLREIADEISQSFDFLETEMRDVPERHRSIRAVFDTIWNRLPDTERNVFMKLSVFRGGFTREAAQAVTGVSLKALASLGSKSLLRRDSSGRYEIHELLRQYAAQVLDTSPQDHAHAQEDHCRYYADFMERQWPQLRSHGMKTALNEIGLDLENVRAAWHTMTQHHKIAEIRKSEKSLYWFLFVYWQLQDGVELFAQAVESLGAAAPGKETDIALGFALQAQGPFYLELGLPSQGKALVEEGLAVLRHHDCPSETILTLESLSQACCFLNEWTALECASLEGIQLAQAHADLQGMSCHLYYLGIAALNQGNYEEARRFGEESLKKAEVGGRLSLLPAIHGHLLGNAAARLGAYEEAERRLLRSIELCSWLGQSLQLGNSYKFLAKVTLLNGKVEAAKQLIQRSIKLFQDSGWPLQIIKAFDTIASLMVAQGRKEQAVELLTFYLNDSSIGLTIDRHDAECLLIELRARLPAEIFAAACERGNTLDVQVVVAELFQEG